MAKTHKAWHSELGVRAWGASSSVSIYVCRVSCVEYRVSHSSIVCRESLTPLHELLDRLLHVRVGKQQLHRVLMV